MLGTDGAYSGDRAKEWGSTGPPHDVELKAAPYKLGSAALVSTWDELVAAITNGYPVTICTDQGFTLTRDCGRFLRGQRNVGPLHAPCRRPLRSPGACIIQSWGPDVPDGPTVLGQPDFSFWVEQAGHRADSGRRR